MKMDDARILVIGAGVNGSVCAVGLYNAGFNVTVLARAKRYEQIRDEGIIIEDPLKNTRSVTRVPVISSLHADDCYDYILVVVRKNQVPDLLPVLAQNRSPNVVFMVNNPSGPDEMTAILGKDRVLMGFVFAGGKRDGDVIRAIGGGSAATPFGEICGTITPRLTRLVAILRQAGFHAKTTANITDLLATHAALVAPIAALTVKYGCDTRALARSTADLRLLVDAWRETLDVLQAVGRRVLPSSMGMIKVIPSFVFVAFLRRLLSSRIGEIGLAWHCSQAPDEMHQLELELEALVVKSGLKATAIRKVLGTG